MGDGLAMRRKTLSSVIRGEGVDGKESVTTAAPADIVVMDTMANDSSSSLLLFLSNSHWFILEKIIINFCPISVN